MGLSLSLYISSTLIFCFFNFEFFLTAFSLPVGIVLLYSSAFSFNETIQKKKAQLLFYDSLSHQQIFLINYVNV